MRPNISTVLLMLGMALRSYATTLSETVDELQATVRAHEANIARLEATVAALASRLEAVEGQRTAHSSHDLSHKRRLTSSPGATRIDMTQVETVGVVAEAVQAASGKMHDVNITGNLHVQNVYWRGKVWEPDWIPTYYPTPLPTLHPTPRPTLQPTSMYDGWTLVRRVISGTTWHPTNDDLTGSAVYGTASTDPTVASTFSIRFDNIAFTEFMFATGDGQHWLIAGKSQVNPGSYYGYATRTITKSSDSASAYGATWLYRSGLLEDPWISIQDHASEVVYGENSHTAHTQYLLANNGCNVWIR